MAPVSHNLAAAALPLVPFAFLLILNAPFIARADEGCVYTVYVQTGSILKGGTDSKISVTISDSSGEEHGVHVANLETWGLMEDGHDYFERGNLDVFSGMGRCLDRPICYLNLTSDGQGQHSGWFCDYLEVTATGPHMGCSQSAFYVRRWLALDAPPYLLSSVINGCYSTTSRPGRSIFHSPGADDRSSSSSS
ncbi:PLAT domain-containing protein 3-like [Nymphaea colorata]|nr:PLAT domain-containing protein 3-like [Nymphaea colorata]